MRTAERGESWPEPHVALSWWAVWNPGTMSMPHSTSSCPWRSTECNSGTRRLPSVLPVSLLQTSELFLSGTTEVMQQLLPTALWCHPAYRMTSSEEIRWFGKMYRNILESWQSIRKERKEVLLSVCVRGSNRQTHRLAVCEFSLKPCWDRARLGERSK